MSNPLPFESESGADYDIIIRLNRPRAIRLVLDVTPLGPEKRGPEIVETVGVPTSSWKPVVIDGGRSAA